MREREFVEVIGRHAGLLGRIAATYEAQPALRDELLQDITLALWKALPRWRGEGSLRAFISRVAHNRAVTHVARQVREKTSVEDPEQLSDGRADPQHAASVQQRYEHLLRALRRLPLGQRQAVTLALEGFSHGEIAHALGLTDNAVDARLSRARRALAALLEYSR
jgi:RNA polymerase sigma factor (sigma-70 family)